MEKTCTICGSILNTTYFKWLKRKRYEGFCYTCHKNNQAIENATDVSILDVRHNIKVQERKGGKTRKQTICYERAKALVQEGMATIVHPTLIRKKFNYEDFRRIIFERDHYQCFYCKRPGNTIDHIVPQAKNGITSFGNCVTSCKECNQVKRDMDLELFLFKHEPSYGWQISEKAYAQEKMNDIYMTLSHIERYITIHLATTLTTKKKGKQKHTKRLKKLAKQTEQTVYDYKKMLRKLF